ncbi:hypothetical protein Cantr_10248 [Candida viswanathii]|uniref:Uncharacterized protein n=1 Tax=Candida viswanathii TaxID=5486 RepID=A0A367YD46_9ASCO|nr:hypothetical protein Cantr_10248 [Candida viswanathii]
MSTAVRSRTSTVVGPGKHINVRQQKLVDETIKNHLKYNDITFRSYLKLRQDLLQQNNAIQLLIREAKKNGQKEEPAEDKEADSEPQDEEMKDVDGKVNKHKTELSAEAIKLEKLKFEVDKRLIIFKLYIQDLKNALTAEAQKHKEGYKSPELLDISNQLEALMGQETHLRTEIDNIKNVQKPMLDKITNLVSNFNTNITSATARIIHPSLLRNKEEDLENSVQINFNHAVFSKLDIQQMFAEVGGNVTEQVDNILDTNSRIFDKFDDRNESSENVASPNLLYKIARSTLHDITSNTDLDEYEELIDRALKDISSSFKENQDIKSKWNAHARKVEKIKLIIEEKDADGDLVMT